MTREVYREIAPPPTVEPHLRAAWRLRPVEAPMGLLLAHADLMAHAEEVWLRLCVGSAEARERGGAP